MERRAPARALGASALALDGERDEVDVQSSSGSSWVTTWIIFSKVVAWMMLPITAAWMRLCTIWFCCRVGDDLGALALQLFDLAAQAFENRLLHVDDAWPCTRGTMLIISTSSGGSRKGRMGLQIGDDVVGRDHL